MMKIIQITDMHVAGETEFTHGVDVRQNFLDILKAARSFAPHLLVLTGDLCYDKPDEQVYRWMKGYLDLLNIPYAIIAGNHDDPALLASVFNIEHLLVKEELYFKRVIGNNTVLFLETSAGYVSPTQLLWLNHELSRLKKDTVIFMHHPPLIGGVPHMDLNYPLRNMEAVQEILFNFPHHISVFCGHYHVEKLLNIKNLTVHITPSTYFQMKWDVQQFSIDHLRIALREINLRKDGVVESAVVYYDGHKNAQLS